MVKISAKDVKKLRDQTGAGMMDCKKALTEADGDFDKAIELLRLKGQKLSLKRADRVATEGVVVAITSNDKTKGVVIKLSCETDFVSKNEDFVALANTFANSALENMPTSIEGLKALPYDNITIGEKVIEQVGVIGEKIDLDAYEFITAECVAPYIHSGYRAGVLVGLNKSGDAIYDAGRDVAMQVAAMKPVALDETGVSQELIEKEIEIGMELARKEGKPEAMLERIAKGKLNKYFKDNTLVNQAFVKDSKQTVAGYLKSVDKDVVAVDFKHVTLV